MNYLNNYSIKTKLGILFLIFCLSIFVLGYVSVQISENSKEKLKMLHDKSQAILLLQNEIILPLYELRETTQSLVMAPNKQLRINIYEKLKRVNKNLDKSFLLIKNNRKTIYKSWLEYKILIEKTKQYLNEKFEEGAYVNNTTTSKKQFDLLVKNLLNIQTTSLNDAKNAYVNAVNEAKSLRIDIVIYVTLILLLSIIIGWLISSNIISSINIVQEGLSGFFDYLNHKKNCVNKIIINSNDEFAQMAEIINLNVHIIQNNIEKNEELIKDATKVLESIRSGNLGNRLMKDVNSETLNELKFMMNDMLDNLEDKIKNEITQKLEQEQILIQQSKLASMGEMIGNIAHQWRQPLAEISAIHMNMKVKYDFDDFNKNYLNKKIKEANKLTSYMSQTILDFQNFFNPQGKKELFSIKKACDDAFFIVESSLKYHNIKTTFKICKDNKIYGFKNEYSQVILNILSNAKDIFLERKIENPYIKIEIKDGDTFAIVKINDNGGGIEEKILNKIFEPYFTTRYKTQGTGIGLYMSKNIIERNMHGFINVKNNKDGACFIIKVLKTMDKS